MSMQYFPLFLWGYMTLFWVRYSYVIERHHYSETQKNQHATLFILTTLVLFLIMMVYSEYSIPLNCVYGTFWLMCLVDIFYQRNIFAQAYKPSSNRYRKYLYNDAKRFRLRVSSGFSIFFAIWIMLYCYEKIMF